MSVAAGYVHVAKQVRPAPPFTAGAIALKWYDIAPGDAPVLDEIHELARTCLHEALLDGEIPLADDELGFVILHRCGAGFYFLLVCTWRNENELWETVWAKDGPQETAFAPWPADGSHRPTFCVWELGAVCHERQAWSAYLRSRRDAPARAAYLDYTFTGDC